uniref:Phospholipid-transporting ATPase n=1 Tax=Nothobranchius furzeri TaxID=105023 RepID=A0A8C6P1A3_NOTFU
MSVWEWLCWRRSDREHLKKKRTVGPSFTEDEELKHKLGLYKNNKIRTTKYSLLSFLPKNLFEQLHRLANIYFLFLAALNFVPVVEAFQQEVSVIPILLVLSATALKDIFEDFRRFKSDRVINKLLCRVYCRKQRSYTDRRWKDVRVGDFVRLSCNEIIPADLLLLYSSDQHGVCYIETANLDGETNLKQRQVVPDLCPQGVDFTPENFHSRIECENPNNDLSRFRGYIENSSKARVGLHSSNLLLRSCTVRNTETVVGIVVYAGHETKAMMNNSGPRYKRSQLERRLNTDVLWCVFILLAMCLTASIGHGIWMKNLQEPVYQVDTETSPALAGFYVFWTMIIVLQVLIPISLYVSIEIVKLGQIYFIHNDLDLYNDQLDSRIQCRALNITEDLGQVQYLFSDKTGTLTENKMVFRRCSIYGIEYPHQENGENWREPEPSQSVTPLEVWMGSWITGVLRLEPSFVFQAKDVVPDPDLVRKLSCLCLSALSLGDGSSVASSLELTFITDFFLALAICNSVVVSSHSQPRHVVSRPTGLGLFRDLDLMLSSPSGFCSTRDGRGPSLVEDQEAVEDFSEEKTGDGCMQDVEDLNGNVESEQDGDDELLYEAESPDEAALVHAARAYRCTLRGRSAQTLMVDLPGLGPLVVQLLHILPFDSNRKRMSVVVRHPLTGQVVVYTKGADSVLMDLAETPREQAREVYDHIREQTQKHLDAYARDGLRTLCIAKKVLEEEEYDLWLKRQLLAESSIENREELLMESAQRLETDLTLLGCTGIVDRLQEDVPETIEALQQAGIRVWVLTGDKQETAVNITNACKLLRSNDQLLTANCGSKDACAALLEELILEVQRGGTSTRELSSSSTVGFVLVIDGRTLDWALQEELKGSFLELSCKCRAVICCRSTPLQKSKVVQLIRDQLGVMTLAVGDGANDVSMIQVADVGIGISGQEGMQAVMSSDFAISRFKHLQKLLLVHGHWCYHRLANMILYFIYKNVMYVNLLFCYQFFCGFSGSVMINSWVLIFFNLIFTSVPPIIYGILDRDTPSDALMKRPELYRAARTTQVSPVYAPSTFWINVLDAFYQSLACFFVPYFALEGSDVGDMSFGSPVNTSALFIILLHQIIESKTLTWIHVLVLVLSAASYFLFTLPFSAFCVICSHPTNLFGVELLEMSQPLFYIICVLSVVTALLPRYTHTHTHTEWLTEGCFQGYSPIQLSANNLALHNMEAHVSQPFFFRGVLLSDVEHNSSEDESTLLQENGFFLPHLNHNNPYFAAEPKPRQQCSL